MPTRSVIAGPWLAGATFLLALLLAILLSAQVVAVALASGSETYAMPQVIAQQLPTPTPFRFLTPTPFLPSTTTTTTTTTPAPRAGGFPLELALPALAGGLAAIGGGSFLLRRKTTR
jgi:hypothetical protein